MILLALYQVIHLNPTAISCLAAAPPPPPSSASPGRTQTNTGLHGAHLMAQFITQTSFLVTDVKDARARLYCRLALLIFQRLLEIPVAAAFMCDEKVQSDVELFRKEGPRMQMSTNTNMPLACSIVGVLVACIEVGVTLTRCYN